MEIIVSFLYSSYTISKTSLTYAETYEASKYEAERYIESVSEDSNIIAYETGDVYFNPILNSLNHIDYVISPSGQPSPDANLTDIGTMGAADIYRNDATINGLIISNSKFADWTFSKTSPYISSNSLINYITGEDIEIFKINRC